uniref:Reverse transcriptase Ty1/copia-type domain-containing protein n=1 Tax=Lactuca sativa TaxID=4236 RepID=A0A9R1UY04_LACSA|nr:hypothetical protein LSAT_V11C700351460 [Lactuca sativa]
MSNYARTPRILFIGGWNFPVRGVYACTRGVHASEIVTACFIRSVDTLRCTRGILRMNPMIRPSDNAGFSIKIKYKIFNKLRKFISSSYELRFRRSLYPREEPTTPSSESPNDLNPVLKVKSLADIYRSTTPHSLPHGLVATKSDELFYEPRTFKQASKLPHWQCAMQEEITSLHKNNTWHLVPPQQEMNVVGCKWIFKVKRKSDGSLERHKARLVAQGFTHQEGLDYAETFIPMVKPSTIRTILSIAHAQRWDIQQLDVRNAFLNGILHEDVYMKQPPGFVSNSFPNHVCKLDRALYGLKQSPRAWFQRLHDFLLRLGFFNIQSDSSLFIRHTKEATTVLLVYVDDIIVTGSFPSMVASVIDAICETFDSRRLGDLHYFLGIEATRNAHTLHLRQTKYALDLLERCYQYRSMVGGLQYLTLTRPDITFSVNEVCQFMHQPRTSHLQATKNILRFIKGTIQEGLSFYPSNTFDIRAYSDSDWAGDPNDRRSTTGACVYIGPNLVSWIAKKQSTVSWSSSEAEYHALATTTAELRWFSYLFHELNIFLHPPSLFCDNLSTLHMARNPVFHACTHHKIDYHFIRELTRWVFCFSTFFSNLSSSLFQFILFAVVLHSLSEFMLAMNEDRAMDMFDAEIVNEGSIDELEAISKLANQCLDFSINNRPRMVEVFSELEAIQLLPVAR